MRTVNIILAAGFGTRMQSELPKGHASSARQALDRMGCADGRARSAMMLPVVVVGHGRAQVEDHLGESVELCGASMNCSVPDTPCSKLRPWSAAQADAVLGDLCGYAIVARGNRFAAARVFRTKPRTQRRTGPGHADSLT